MSYHNPPTNKALGQHWLDDDASLDAMVQAAGVGPADTVLEVGPGPGALTARLVARVERVVAVEFDPALAGELPRRVPAGNLTVVQQDILAFDLSALPSGYKVVANIPYYLTSNLMRLLCEAPNHFSQAALLIQKEVAERVCARPGTMSLLSVAVQYYAEAALGPVVPAALFTPPPKVDSQILRLTYRAQPLFGAIDTPAFFRVVKAGFSQRRKTILNALGAGLHLNREQTLAVITEAGVPPDARAQNLSLQDWHRLYIAHQAAKM